MELIFSPEKNSIYFIWKVFTVTFEEMSLLNKSVKFFKKKKMTQNFWLLVYVRTVWIIFVQIHFPWGFI